MYLTKSQKRNVIHGVGEVPMNKHLADPDLSPDEEWSNFKSQKVIDSHLFGSTAFLLLCRPSMMEKELAGSNSVLTSS